MKTSLIGPGIFLLVVGAILNWAVADRISGVDLHLIGLILMAGGALAILLGFLVPNGGGYRATRATTVDPATGGRVERVNVDGV